MRYLKTLWSIRFEKRSREINDRKLNCEREKKRGSWLNRNDGFLVSPLQLVKLSCGPANRAHSRGFFRKWLSTSALRKSRQGAEWSSTACEIKLEADWIFMRRGISLSLSSSASSFSSIESWRCHLISRWNALSSRWRRAFWWKCRLSVLNTLLNTRIVTFSLQRFGRFVVRFV